MDASEGPWSTTGEGWTGAAPPAGGGCATEPFWMGSTMGAFESGMLGFVLCRGERGQRSER